MRALLPLAVFTALWAAVPVSAEDIRLDNGQLALSVASGRLGALIDLRKGRKLADGYSYHLKLKGGQLQRIEPKPLFLRRDRKPGIERLRLGVVLGFVEIHHEFSLSTAAAVLEETATVFNRSGLEIEAVDFGFATSDVELDLGAIPFGHPVRYRHIGYPPYRVDALLRNVDLKKAGGRVSYGSEGWTLQKDLRTLVVSKLNRDVIEFSVLRYHESPRPTLAFGGTATWFGYPERTTYLRPGQSFRSGASRYELIDGGWKSGFYAYRKNMESLGFGLRPGYSSKLFWNELFDNPAFLGETPQLRALYTRAAIQQEALKARAIGAQTLYLDPGWDTLAGSAIWDEGRLGPLEEFIKQMKDLGLSVAVHAPFSGMMDPLSYSSATWTTAPDKRTVVCSGAEDFLTEHIRRHQALAKAGIDWMMFDGTQWTGHCRNPAHGHPVPYRRDDHVASILRWVQAVKSSTPSPTIELADPIIPGQPARMTPAYFLYDKPNSWDEAWASEFMWEPFTHIKNSGAIALYYYNLAHSIPTYLHIDLKDDSPLAVSPWWYASTCRHLGIGGTHSSAKTRDAQRAAIARYLEFAAFFQRGTFYGLDERIHAHTLAENGESLLVLFNLDNDQRSIELDFTPNEIGFAKRSKVQVLRSEGKIDAGSRGRTAWLSAILPPYSAAWALVKEEAP